MKKQKQIKILLIFLSITVISLGTIQYAAADPTINLISTYTSTSANGQLAAIHPSDNSFQSLRSAKIYLASNQYIYNSSFNIKEYGSPNCVLRGILLNSAYETLEISTNTITTETTTTSYAFYNFTYSGSTLFEASTIYYSGVYVQSAVLLDSTNYVVLGQSGTGFTGFTAIYSANAFSLYNVKTVHNLYGSETQTAPASPTPAPSTITNNAPDVWAISGLNNYLSLIAPLIVLIIPAFIGYKFAGAWGFWAGLNLGAIICYAVLGSAVFPLWGIVALLIVDGLLLFGKVGFRT